MSARRARRYHYSVYVIELSKDVLNEPRFRKANQGYRLGFPCVYVGMTGLSPDVRFDKHKAGIQSNRFAMRYGLHLAPKLYEMYNPMPYDGCRARDGGGVGDRAARQGLRRLAGLMRKGIL